MLRPAPLSLALVVLAMLTLLSTLPPERILGACGLFWSLITELMVAFPELPSCLKCLLNESLLEELDPLRAWLEVGDVGA